MKKGFKITAIVIGVILILMFLLPFAFRGKIEGIVKSEGNKCLTVILILVALISAYSAISPKLPSP